MQLIPRDATPTWDKPKYPLTPRDAAPRFDFPPLPLILPDFPEPETIPPELIWLADEKQLISASVETYGLLFAAGAPFQIDGAVLAVAAVMGGFTDDAVDWVTAWTSEQGNSTAPGLIKDHRRLIIYREAFTTPGVLTVRAIINHINYGPLILRVTTNRLIDAAKVITATHLGSL